MYLGADGRLAWRGRRLCCCGRNHSLCSNGHAETARRACRAPPGVFKCLEWLVRCREEHHLAFADAGDDVDVVHKHRVNDEPLAARRHVEFVHHCEQDRDSSRASFFVEKVRRISSMAMKGELAKFPVDREGGSIEALGGRRVRRRRTWWAERFPVLTWRKSMSRRSLAIPAASGTRS